MKKIREKQKKKTYKLNHNKGEIIVNTTLSHQISLLTKIKIINIKNANCQFRKILLLYKMGESIMKIYRKYWSKNREKQQCFILLYAMMRIICVEKRKK